MAILINPYRFAAAGEAPHWQELGRTTLSGSADTITVDGLETKKYLMFFTRVITTDGDVSQRLTFNNDTGANYAQKRSADGGSDSPGASKVSIDGLNDDLVTDSVGFGTFNAVNVAGQEKLVQSVCVSGEASGAGNAPTRDECVFKWANTSNAITRIDINNNKSGSYASGSEVVVLGCDPADTTGTSVWEELADVTLGGAGDTLDSGTFTAKKYLMYQVSMIPSGNFRTTYRLNSDSGANYALRKSEDGGTDNVTSSQTEIKVGNEDTATDYFDVTYLSNLSANEKIMINHNMRTGGAGDGNAPKRVEATAKWANTSAQITSIQAINDQGGNFGIGSRIKVWGFD